MLRSDIKCSTCDDYQLVPGGDGMLEPCPDCLAKDARPFCGAHGRRVNPLGKCPDCRAESVAGELLILARIAGREAVAA